MSYSLDTIRLLIAHDSQDDAEQLVNTLRNAGKITRAELALTEDDVIKALKSSAWEVIFCRPSIGAMTVSSLLERLNKLGKSTPVILLADDMSADDIVSQMKEGVRYVVQAGNSDLLMMYMDRCLEMVHLRKSMQQSQIHLHEAEKRLSVLMDQSRDAIAYVVDGMHIHANEAYLESFGYTDVDDLAGVPIMDMVSADDHESLKKLLRSRAQDENQVNELQCKGVSMDGKEFAATFVFSASNYDGEACTQIVIRTANVDEGALEQKLEEMRQMDSITGLYNRNWFMDQLDNVLAHSGEGASVSAVFMLRVDDFETHQAKLGIDGSDELLGQIAMELEKFSGDSPLARISGEDFAILKTVEDLDEAADIAEKIRESFEKLMPAVGAKTVKMTVSIGVAFVREDSLSAQAVITKALECCNKAHNLNDSQGNAVYVHNPMDDVEAGSSDAIAMQLRSGLEKNELLLKFQALMSLEEETGGFVETYVTLPQADGTELSAAKFMTVAHERGLAGKVDRWVVLNAMKRAAAHSAPVKILVNLSGYAFEDASLPDWIGKALKAVKMSGDRVVFQFSEADVEAYLKQAAIFTKKVGELGVGVSINRFGLNTDPLSVLQHVPASTLKMDPSYTEGLTTPEGKTKLSEIVSQLSSSNKQVIVGYIESAAQMQTLWAVSGVNYLQGYYLQKPGDDIHLGED